MPDTEKDNPATNLLSLTRKSGDEITISKETLDQWLADAETSIQSSAKPKILEEDVEGLAVRLLSYYGLQNSTDVIAFLHSPAGETVLEMIEEEIAEMAVMQQQAMEENLEAIRLEQRIKVFLLLALIYREDAKAERIRDFIRELIHKHASEGNQASKTSVQTEVFAESTRAYEQSEEALEDTLKNKFDESDKLEKALELLQRDETVLVEKYQTFDEQIDDAFHEISELPEDNDTKIARIEERISQLSTAIDTENDEISALLDSGEEEAARARLQTNNARNIHVAVLKDLLSVIKQEKIMLKRNEDGSLEPAKSFHDVDFIVPSEYKIVNKEGKMLLLRTGQSENQLSPEEIDKAERSYQKRLAEMTGVKALITQNQGLETTAFQAKKEPLVRHSETLQQEILLLTNQLTQIQAAKANANEAMSLSRPATKPALSPLPNSPSSASAGRTDEDKTRQKPTSTTETYRHVLELMSKGRPSEQGLIWLKKIIANSGNTELQKQVNGLKPGMPIPQQTMRLLLQRADLPGLGGDIGKESQAQEESSLTAPTPFRKSPRPEPR
jgi:effector protein LidA